MIRKGASQTTVAVSFIYPVHVAFVCPLSQYANGSVYGACQSFGSRNSQFSANIHRFLRLETLIGSQVVESINQYNQVAGFLYANTQMDVSQKYGQQAALGYFNNTGIPSLEGLDGRACTATETGSFSAPLVGLLSSSAKLIPAFAMPSISVQLTMDSIANMFSSLAASVPTVFQISNIELSYNMLDFGRNVESAILAMPKLFLKCYSFSNSSASIATGTSGSMSLVYNQKLHQ